jgi:hypothetical protein
LIRYNLICNNDHNFESWFRDSTSCDDQIRSKKVVCPECNSNVVTKALMSPRIPKKGISNNQENTVLSNGRNNNLNNAIRKIRDEIKKNSEYVGKEFPEEARKIHYHESEERSIYGEATAKDIKELHEEGIDIIHIPNLPDDKN